MEGDSTIDRSIVEQPTRSPESILHTDAILEQGVTKIGRRGLQEGSKDMHGTSVALTKTAILGPRRSAQNGAERCDSSEAKPFQDVRFAGFYWEFTPEDRVCPRLQIVPNSPVATPFWDGRYPGGAAIICPGGQ